MGRKISDENSYGHRHNFFVFKILNLLTLLKQEGAQWQEPIFVLIALCVNLIISRIFYSQKDEEP